MQGKIICDIPPGHDNPRNSEGAFIRLKDGTIMFIYSRFSGDKAGDDVSADIAALYSHDDGETFGGERILFTRLEYGAKNIMSVSALRLSDGRIAVFHCIRRGFHDTRLFMRISDDEGATFDEGRYCINYPGYFVTNNDRTVLLSNGRIMVPASYHRCLGPDFNSWETFNGVATARFFYSDDSGGTFFESPGFGALNVPTNTGLQEPGVVETEPGCLLCFCRTDLGSQYVSHSRDYGLTWEPFMPSRFTSPTSPMTIKPIPGANAFIAVYNPVANSPVTHSKAGWGRNPLVYSISTDGCRTFGDLQIIEDDRTRGFCYPTVFFNEDYMLMSYCAGGEEDVACLNRIRIRKFKTSELGGLKKAF
ncbi:MAG: sialidase family protein [Clostridia bacterium]